jgi:DNA-binding CsgD family transcriptional regulator
VADVRASLRDAGVTPREAEVLEALAERLTNAEIAERLVISMRTVESHVSSLLRKLGESDRRSLAARARALARPAPTPFPAALAAARHQRMVGRTEQLSQLLAQAARARAGEVRRLFLLRGDAGIGKTRLAAELAARLYDEGALVLYGRCQQDALVPYQGLRDALGDVASNALDPEHGDQRTSADRYRLFEKLDRLLAGQPVPVTLVLDDVQWMDPSGLQLLRHLMHHSARSALVVLITSRPEATDPRHPLARALAEAASAGAAGIVELGALPLEAARELAVDIGSPGAVKAEQAWRRAGGNPFLLSELLRLPLADDRLPSSARDAIVQRVAGLGAPVFEVLAAAAVLDERIALDTVREVLGEDIDRVEAALENAFRAGLVVGEETPAADYRFAHAIIREALQVTVSAAHRSRVHLAAAQHLECRGPAASPDVARHRHAALPQGNPVQARQAAVAAYRHTFDRWGFEVAVSCADMALDAVEAGGGDETDRAEALLLRGRARVRAGDLEGVSDCRRALELANRHGLGGLRADATLSWAEAAPIWGRDDALRVALEGAIADPELGQGTRAVLTARLAQASYYDEPAEVRARLTRAAVAHARADGRPETLASVLTITHAALAGPAALEERAEIAQQAVAGASAAGDPDLEVAGLGWLAVDLLERGDRRGAEDAFARHERLATRLGNRMYLRDVEAWAAMRAVLDGQYDQAAAHIERARDLGEAAHDPSAGSVYWVQRYWCAVESGDPTAMDDVVEPCEHMADRSLDVPAWRAASALLHTRRGDTDAAGRHYTRLAHDHFASIPDDVVWLNAMTYLAETASFLDDRGGAGTLRGLLGPHAERVVVIDRGFACKGSVHRFLGLLAATTGDEDAAEHHLRAAVRQHRALDAGPLTERVLTELAALRHAGAGAGARTADAPRVDHG